MGDRHVVITGLGVVSCAGLGKDAFWKALVERRSGISRIESFSTDGFRSVLGGEIKGTMPRLALAYAREAARQALADAAMDAAAIPSDRAGVALGTTQGEWLKIAAALTACAQGASRRALMEEAFPHFPGGIPAALGRELGLGGPNIMLTCACAAGNFALAHAFEKIRCGRADLMLAGGVDVLNRDNYAGFNRLMALAPEACAPFSLGRKGIVPAEGCAILILEESQAALRRGARVYAEMLGYGVSCDARHVTSPDMDGVARAMADCLNSAGLSPSDVDYINAHGTGTPANDKTETAAVKRVFGERSREVPISSIKSVLGHAMGAATALEAAACCLALDTGVLPPTANHRPGDPDCDLDYVAEGPRKTSPRVVLSDGFAFGGSNAVIALARPGFASGKARAASREDRPRLVVTGLALVEDPEPLRLAESLLPDKDLGFVDKPIAYALAAAVQALRDAGLDPAQAGDRIGVVLDSSGELGSQLDFHRDLLTGGPAGVEPMMFPSTLANAVTSRMAVLLGLKLVSESIAGSFPGGESALACACDFLSGRGRGILLAGGVWSGTEGCPFPLPEGAVIFVLEEREAALARRARMLAEVRQWQESFDPSRPPAPTSPRLLLETLRKVSQGGPSAVVEARGLWGSVIRLSLAPAS
jgi:3-oxoacyl-[acyl-carrier-protein] synthase II